MNARYPCKSGDESALSFGDAGWPTILVLQPLFEEANRTRHVLVSAMRALAKNHAVASVLPDLPGTGDSLIAMQDARWDGWVDGAKAAASAFKPAMTLSVRGGALLDSFAGSIPAWRLVPEAGSRLLRDMVRASAMSAGLSVKELAEKARLSPTLLAGNLIAPELYEALDVAVPEPERPDRPIRTVLLNDQPDESATASAVWRRAEPTRDDALVDLIVTDIVAWMGQCGLR